MDKKEILEFISQNPMGCLASIEDLAARARFMDTFKVDEDGLIFYTGKAKNVFKQIEKNPNVEVCYFAKGIQIRVRGKIEIVEDLNLKKEVVLKRPFLKRFYEKDEDYKELGLLKLKGKASVWTMKNLTEDQKFVDL